MFDQLNDIIMYLDDINGYVNSILYYYSCNAKERKNLDLNEIIMYLLTVNEITEDIKEYLYNNYANKD